MVVEKMTTGEPKIDRLIGKVIEGDNIVWEVDSGAPLDHFISSFISSCEYGKSHIVYVSFNQSPQTISGKYANLMSEGHFILVDCFSSGKGNGDKMFLKFFKNVSSNRAVHASILLEEPANPSRLQDTLVQIGSTSHNTARYIFDSLTGMLDLWENEERVIRFFGHFCPRLFDLNTVAYWLLEKDAHSDQFLAKVRHITQVVVDVAVRHGTNTLTIRKAANRHCMEIGVPNQFYMDNGSFTIIAKSREERELGLLTRIGEILDSALDLNSFFERTMDLLAGELNMVHGTLVLLDRISSKLKIVAVHGLFFEEQAQYEYKIGEGVIGEVVETGIPKVISDIKKESHFLNWPVTPSKNSTHTMAFICVPLRVDDEVIGALSVDRPLATESALSKDLRLLTIVGSIVSQVIKINRIIQVEKEEILTRNETHLHELRNRYQLDNIIGESETMQTVLTIATIAAKSKSSVLITGETGTGKELVANVIHYNSPRGCGPFVKVNCGALPETLLESELFGHVKGAFTGALRDRKGRFEIANGGTLFLDEIGEMSAALQIKLLRVLQEREFEQVGSTQTVRVDVRVVTATAKDLKEEIMHGRFREDLYYRLNVIPIHLPPLCNRREDIPLLVNHFLKKYNQENEKNVTKLSRDVLDLILEYPWPGNIRELENCIERSVVLSPGETLLPCLLPIEILQHKRNRVQRQSKTSSLSDIAEIRRVTECYCNNTNNLAEVRRTLIQTIEETIIRTALTHRISQRDLAQRLGMSRMTLRKRITKYGIKYHKD